MTALITLALLLQSDDPFRLWDIQRQAAEDAARRAAAERNHETYQARELAQRFNALTKALQEFRDAYVKGGGNVWPRKEARRVEKAYRHLQGCDCWLGEKE